VPIGAQEIEELQQSKGEEREVGIARLHARLVAEVKSAYSEIAKYSDERTELPEYREIPDSPEYVNRLLLLLKEAPLRPLMLLYITLTAMEFSLNDLRRLLAGLGPSTDDPLERLTRSLLGLLAEDCQKIRSILTARYDPPYVTYRSYPDPIDLSSFESHFKNPECGTLQALSTAVCLYKWFIFVKPQFILQILDYFEEAHALPLKRLLEEICWEYFSRFIERTEDSESAWRQSFAHEMLSDYRLAFAKRASEKGDYSSERTHRLKAAEALNEAYWATRSQEAVFGELSEEEIAAREDSLFSEMVRVWEPLMDVRIRLPERWGNESLVRGVCLLLVGEIEQGRNLLSGLGTEEDWATAREIQQTNPEAVPILYERLGDSPDELVLFYTSLFIQLESEESYVDCRVFGSSPEWLEFEASSGTEPVARLAIQGMDDRQRQFLANALQQGPTQTFLMGWTEYSAQDRRLLQNWYRRGLSFLREAMRTIPPRVRRGPPPRLAKGEKREIGLLLKTILGEREDHARQFEALHGLERFIPEHFPRNLFTLFRRFIFACRNFTTHSVMFGVAAAQRTDERAALLDQIEPLLNEWLKNR